MTEHENVEDAIKLEKGVRISFEGDNEDKSPGLLFKGEGIFDVWVDAEHLEGISKYPYVEDPILMPGKVVTLNNPNAGKQTMKGEIMRLKPHDC